MAHVHKQPSSLSGQHYYLHHLHRHTQPQRPALLSPPMSDSSGRGSVSGSGTENEASQNKEQFHTSAWRLKLRQQTMTQTLAQTQQQQQSNGDTAHTTPKPHHIPTNENECLNQNNIAHEKEWRTPAAMSHNLLKSFGPPLFNRGSSSSITITTHTTEELKKSLERAFAACEDDDPVKWTIQTLFEIGTRCAQQAETMQLNEEGEKRVSQVVIDVFQTYRARQTWGDGVSIENENGIKDHNKNSERSGMNERACSVEHMRRDVDKMKDSGDGGDLISLEENDEEKEKEGINGFRQVAAQKIGLKLNHKKEHLCSITQTHRQMLLDAILEGKSALQVFLAIDIFELRDSLSILPPIRGIKNNNTSLGIEYEKAETIRNGDQNTNGNEQQRDSGADYGSLLTINLIQRGYLHAAIQMTSRLRNLQHHRHLILQQNGDKETKEEENEKGKENMTMTSAQQLLARRLLDMGHPDLIHLFVNSDRELCRTVLQMIDSRFAGQIWAWIQGEVIDSSLLDPFLVVQCRIHASSSTPASPLTAPSEIYPLQMLCGMLEVANSLWMSFGLENTMKRCRSIQLIQEYCTVLSLLLTNNRMHWHCTPHRQAHYKQKRNAIHAPENALNLTPWMFIPSVLPILKQNPALQRLVVWTFAIHEDGVATAEFLASAFKLRAFFVQCVGHTSEREGDDEQYRDEENNDQALRDGGTKLTSLLLEQPLTRGQGQSVDQNSNYKERSSKAKEKHSSNYEGERAALSGENNAEDHEASNPSEFYKSAGPLLSESIAQMSLSGVSNKHYTNHSNAFLPLAVDLQYTYTRPTLSPLRTKPSSAPSSTATLSKTSPSKRKTPFLIHRPHTTASTTITKKQLFYSQKQTLDYKPSPETTIILLSQMSQLQSLYDSLFNSDSIGMSLIRPLDKPWANFSHHPEKFQQMQLSQYYQQQLLHQKKLEQEQQRMKRERGSGGDGGCAYLQLACSSDKRVYVIDLEVFQDDKTDPLHKFPRLLGEIFFNPSICKLGRSIGRKTEIVIARSLSPPPLSLSVPPPVNPCHCFLTPL